ncbi:hypothetical protein [Pengzhenrongella sp.]|jgi:hypothetical protein|uniref:hypothetical protein n=1 Tax=Pengzhenrongella sp. TaxID=2888820 RepID=UPI002F94A1C0
MRTTTRRFVPAGILAALLLATAPPASAADFVVDLPSGVACPGFAVRVASVGGNLQTREFTDEAGNVVRTIAAGKGATLTFTNLGPLGTTPGKSVTLRPNGSVTRTATSPDGTVTYTSTGHNVLILFPTDVPAGPTTTQYIGNYVFTVDPISGVFTLLSTSGRSVDICAELA